MREWMTKFHKEKATRFGGEGENSHYIVYCRDKQSASQVQIIVSLRLCFGSHSRVSLQGAVDSLSPLSDPQWENWNQKGMTSRENS